MSRRRLRVNPILCTGYGYCAELFPERITLDDWGYPIVDEREFGDDLDPHAKRAVDACPRQAVLLRNRDGER
jgi:ferredoxin